MKATPAKASTPSKPHNKVAAKAPKTAAKAAPAKAAAKKPGTAKPAAEPPAKPPLKAAAKPSKKTASRPAAKAKPSGAKPLAGVARKPTVAQRITSTPSPKPAVKNVASTKPMVHDKIEVPMPVKAPPKIEPKAVAPAPPPPMAPAVAQRTGRPSSRLASLTVPSMAQSVASTAAKASYSQVTSVPMIVPPLPSATKKDPKLANNWKTKAAGELSDAELLAMPDTEYMNEKQMAAFRLKLALLKQEILNSAGETTEHLREDTVVVPDPADRATIEEEHALELRTRDRERKLLKKIEQSIARIDSGDYGYCDETGEPIGVGRLLARPTATLSLEAQQRRELKQKMFGD